MILVVYGTRPEYIKIKPLIDEMSKNDIPYKTLFTGQHKDIVSKVADFNIKMEEKCDNRLNNIILNCMSLSDEIFQGINYVLIQGDTTTALGLSLAAYHRKIKLIHLEAGLRTFDFENPYPEEANRVLISRIANIHFCPTKLNKKNLIKENVSKEKIFVVGNTVLDNLLKYKKDCSYDNKVLITMHRRENHDEIKEWFLQINELVKKYPEIEFILPIHPNPNVQKHKDILNGVNIINPLSHDDLINLLVKCKLIITDSGGIQEECSFFNKKCIVCRKVTERPESVGMTSFLCETPNDLVDIFENHLKNFKTNEKSPFGNGNSSKKIIKILKNENI